MELWIGFSFLRTFPLEPFLEVLPDVPDYFPAAQSLLDHLHSDRSRADSGGLPTQENGQIRTSQQLGRDEQAPSPHGAAAPFVSSMRGMSNACSKLRSSTWREAEEKGRS